jgi:hypothetical protein
VAAETVHGWLLDLLPDAPALVLDVGRGPAATLIALPYAGWKSSPLSRAVPCAQKRNGCILRL